MTDPNERMPLPPAAVDLITRFEKLSLEPYRDEGGNLTIGWGHTGKGTLQPRLTQEEAVQYLEEDLKEAAAGVRDLVQVPLNENQFAALLSFTFNLGRGNLGKSTLLKRLNAGDFAGAVAEFQRWNKVRIGGFLKKSTGLVRRRSAEEQLFRTPPRTQIQVQTVPAAAALDILVDPESSARGGDERRPPQIRPGMEQVQVTLMIPMHPVWTPDKPQEEEGPQIEVVKS
jgi:lysozyme